MNFKMNDRVRVKCDDKINKKLQGKCGTVVGFEHFRIIVSFSTEDVPEMFASCDESQLEKISEEKTDSQKIEDIYQMMKELTEKVNSLEANFDTAVSGAKSWLLEKGPTLPIFGTFIKQAMRK